MPQNNTLTATVQYLTEAIDPSPGALTEVLYDIEWSIKITWESLLDLSNLVLIHQDLVWNGLITFGQAPGERSIIIFTYSLDM